MTMTLWETAKKCKGEIWRYTGGCGIWISNKGRLGAWVNGRFTILEDVYYNEEDSNI